MPTITQTATRIVNPPPVLARSEQRSMYAALEVTIHTDSSEVRPGRAIVPVPAATAGLVQAAAGELARRTTGQRLEDVFAAGVWPAVDDSGGYGLAAFKPAVAAVTDALWDLRATLAGLPLWRLAVGLSPAELVQGADLRLLSDVLDPAEARNLLNNRVPGRAAREGQAVRFGYPAAFLQPVPPNTVAGMEAVARSAVSQGFSHVVIELGPRPELALLLCRAAREAGGPDLIIVAQASASWEVDTAIDVGRELIEIGPVWLAEPLPAVDACGLATVRRGCASSIAVGSPLAIAAGADLTSRLEAKQLLQAGSVDLLRLDPVSVGGLSEALAVLLLAARFRVPVCPIGRGPGGALAASRLGLIDFVAIGASLDLRAAELDVAGAGWATAPLTISEGSCLLGPPSGPTSQAPAEPSESRIPSRA